MGGRFTVVLGALAALGLAAACGGQSIRRADGDSGASGEGNAGTGGSNGARDSGGPKGGTTSTGGTTSSSGGSGPRDNKPPPLEGGATGAGATSGSSNGTGGGTIPGGGGASARGGSGATGGSGIAIGGGSACADPTRIPLLPDATGWIDPATLCDSIEVQGGWFAFGDQYGDANCLKQGQHMPSECALIVEPDPNGTTFPNVNGFMQTAGTVEKILSCVAGVTTDGCPLHDYSNMWGAGIGFDLKTDPAELGGAHHVWNALAHLADGIEFTIDQVPLPGLRVEFAMALTDEECDAASPPLPHGSTTDEHPVGAPYWGARGDHTYPLSPVVAGVNQIVWDQVEPPQSGYYVFDPSRLIGVRFHIPTNSTTSYAYHFAISNVTVLRTVLRLRAGQSSGRGER